MRLKIAEFDLLYLALLTKEQVKPLSRWEKKFGPGEIKALKSLGLKTRSIERRLESGQKVDELVFSASGHPIDSYADAFERKPIDHSLQSALLEGKLFGYPECCVNSYAKKGYLPNGLPEDDQRLLFHWACPGCQVTNRLLPGYRSAYEEAQRLRQKYTAGKHWQGRLAVVVPSLGLASCLLLGGCTRQPTDSTEVPNQVLDLGTPTIQPDTPYQEPDIHWLAVEDDSDQDYLKDGWEDHFGLDQSNQDTDGNGVLDGPQLAKRLWDTIQDPPAWIEVHHYLMRGVVRCAQCGEAINMGHIWLANTSKSDTTQISYLALHYMEHGSLAHQAEGGITEIVNPIELDSLLSK
jgi:hypothetical protein